MALPKKMRGSALLVVIAFSTLISIVTFNWWWRASMQYDLVTTRERFYKNFHMADTILEQAISFAKNNFDALIEQGSQKKISDFVLDLRQDESDDGHHRFCMITPIYKNSFALRIFVRYGDKQNDVRLVCTLTEQDFFDATTQQTQRNFFVKNYTLV